VYGLDLISQERGNADSYFLVDGLGSTRGLTDASGVVTDTYSYDAFGNSIASAGGTANNYLFAGEQFDPSLGDYYLRQRYYDTDTGRFTRRDTFEGYRTKPVTLHDYLYANANPITFIDPSGLTSITEVTSVRNMADILSSSVRIGGRFLDTVDRVNGVVDLISSISQAFQFASNPGLVIRNLSASGVVDQIALIGQPNFIEDAALALQENTGRIIKGIITQKLPQEKQLIASYLQDKDSRYAFFAPSIIGGVRIPTPFKIQQKKVDIVTNSRAYRLFGMGMIKSGRRQDIPMQFFRIDFGLAHPTATDRQNYDVWSDNTQRFHFHIPKNN
jgi:RHS repeat-associated protein